MQFTKDSFYLALHDRLTRLNPSRTVTINGVTRAAIVVLENEPITAAPPMANTFYLDFRAPKAPSTSPNGLLSLDCVISFEAESTAESGTDRGRILSQLTMELLSICVPPHGRKRDFTESPSADLGTDIFWTDAHLDDTQPPTSSSRLRRTATLTIFFFPEQELL